MKSYIIRLNVTNLKSAIVNHQSTMKRLLYIFFVLLGLGAFAQQIPLIDAQFKGVNKANDTVVLNLNSLGYASYTIYTVNDGRYGEQGKYNFGYKNSEDITFKDENTILFSTRYNQDVIELKRELRSKDENFLKVNITIYDKTYTTTIKDYGNVVENNISLVNHLNWLDFVLFDNEHHTSGLYNFCCAGCDYKNFYNPVSFREIEKNDKRNIMKISGCNDKEWEEHSFEYDSSDKLTKIKIRLGPLSAVSKIEWL